MKRHYLRLAVQYLGAACGICKPPKLDFSKARLDPFFIDMRPNAPKPDDGRQPGDFQLEDR